MTKFKNPTVAEAIVGFLKSELKTLDAKKTPQDDQERYRHRRNREQVQRTCLGALVRLKALTAAPEIAKLAREATDLEDRKLRALAAHALKDSEPARELIRDFQAQKLELFKLKITVPEERDSPFINQLSMIVDFMIDTNLPEADQALLQLADGEYPCAATIEKKVLESRAAWHDDDPWLKHAFCLRVLRRMLENTTLTEGKYEVSGNTLSHRTKNSTSSGSLPDFLKEPDARIDATNVRVCDEAGEKLSSLLSFAPRYHPLLKNADEQLSALKREYDRFGGNFRQVTWFERRIMNLDHWNISFVPDIHLDQPATAADVTSGKAIFHLAGRGKPTKLELPAAAKLVNEVKNNEAPYYLILQAELDEGGNTILGVVSKSECTKRPAGDFGSIQSIAEMLKELEEKQKTP